MTKTLRILTTTLGALVLALTIGGTKADAGGVRFDFSVGVPVPFGYAVIHSDPWPYYRPYYYAPYPYYRSYYGPVFRYYGGPVYHRHYRYDRHRDWDGHRDHDRWRDRDHNRWRGR